jgi:ATP-dependent Clp protease protease subunit
MKSILLAMALILSQVATAADTKPAKASAKATASKASGQREVVLSKDNTLVLDMEVDGESVSKILEAARQMDAANKSGYPLILFLNTPGGSIQDGLELIEGLSAINRPVNTITLFSASMGWQTVQHLGKRYILKNGVLMSHKARGGFRGEFGDGISQLDSRYALWMERIRQMDQQTVDRTNGKQTLKSYRAQYENEMWLTGDQAVKQGYADEVVTVRCDKSLAGTREVTVSFFFVDIALTFSECPVITYPLKIDVILPTNKGQMKMSEFLSKGGTFPGKKIETESSYGLGDLYVTDPNVSLQEARRLLNEYKKELSKSLDEKKVIRGY